MTTDRELPPEQLALLGRLNPDCPICAGENINALTHTADTIEACPWCNPIIQAVYGNQTERPQSDDDDDPIPL